MSDLKYKVKDRFKHYRKGCVVEIIEIQGGENPYVLTSGIVGNDDTIDAHYIQIEPEEQVWENPSDFKKIFSSLCDMVEAKDKNYGNAALQPLDIFAKHHPYGSRLDEKLARVKNSDVIRKNDVGDLIGGLALICKSNGWTNFDDQID